MWYAHKRVSVSRFTDVFVGGDSGVVHGECSIFETGQAHYSSVHPLAHFNPPYAPEHTKRVAAVASCCQVSPANYFHFLTEVLARLVLIKLLVLPASAPVVAQLRSGSSSGGGAAGGGGAIQVLAPAAGAHWTKQVLKLLQLPVDDVVWFQAGHTAVSATELFSVDWHHPHSPPPQAPPPPQQHDWRQLVRRPGQEFNTPPAALAAVQQATAGWVRAQAPAGGGSGAGSGGGSSDDGGPLVLFVSRGDATPPRRHLSNDAEVLRAVEGAVRSKVRSAAAFAPRHHASADPAAPAPTAKAPAGGAEPPHELPALRARAFAGRAVTLAQSARAFARARVVVGVHGAGLSNIVFCRPGARVLELALPEPQFRHFMHLAAALGLPYRAVLHLPPSSFHARAVHAPPLAVARAVRAALNELYGSAPNAVPSAGARRGALQGSSPDTSRPDSRVEAP
jgi:hypothetical protein